MDDYDDDIYDDPDPFDRDPDYLNGHVSVSESICRLLQLSTRTSRYNLAHALYEELGFPTDDLPAVACYYAEKIVSLVAIAISESSADTASPWIAEAVARCGSMDAVVRAMRYFGWGKREIFRVTPNDVEQQLRAEFAKQLTTVMTRALRRWNGRGLLRRRMANL